MAQTLPIPLFGVISTVEDPSPRCAVSINGSIVELGTLWQLQGPHSEGIPSDIDIVAIFKQPTLNQFSELPISVQRFVRRQVTDQFMNGSIPDSCLVSPRDITSHLPMSIANYADFFCSLEHARNCAALAGGDVTPNFYSSPICYNGRASSVTPSPIKINRPRGVFNDATSDGPKTVYSPSKKLDFELELGYFVSRPLPRGRVLSIEEAPDYIFGFVLLNDWSTRDVQAFEMRPLGPFHSKGFGTSISSWIVPLDALETFAATPKHSQSPGALDHLKWSGSHGTFDINVTATVIRNRKSQVIAKSNLRDLYWSPFQQLTHLASSGSGMASGDLIGTGTISGSADGSQGCLFEATFDSTKPISLQNEQYLGYLEDYDEVVLDAWCGSEDEGPFLRFPSCHGQVLPAESLV